MNEEELKAFRNLNTFSTKYIVNKKASSENDITTMFVYIAKLEVELEHKDKEIERLNNIINELEKYINEQIERSDYTRLDTFDEVYDYLQELKGSESNE